jgi:hypothetical protein
MKSELEKAVVFALLMQSNEGILSKSPEYVLEKWRTVHALDDPTQVLDRMNRSLLEKWKSQWPSSESE